jgi:hypothetical protein
MTPEKAPVRPVTPEQFIRQRRGRNLVLGGVLLFMVLLFFAISIAQMSR